MAPILVHPDFSKPFYMETNTSNFALEVVLFQEGEGRRLIQLHSIPEFFLAVEIYYEIHDKEFLAIVNSFQEWRHLLEGASHQVTIYTNHKSLEYFITTRVLNRRQARWNISLSQFDFVITYMPGKQQRLFDALSRQSSLAPKEGKATYEQQWTILLKAEQLCFHATTISILVDSSFLNQVCAASTMDPLDLDIKHRFDNNREKFKFLGNLYFGERLYISKH
jgi:hypothetical protein